MAKLKPKKTEVKTESVIKVQVEAQPTIPEPTTEQKETLLVRGGHKFRKVTIFHKSGDITSQLELVE